MKRAIALLAACLAVTCVLLLRWNAVDARQIAGDRVEMVAQFEQLAQRSPLAPATYTFALRDLQTGELVASSGGDNSMVPASTLKLFATSFAFSQFPLSQRWTTQVVLPHPVREGVAESVVLVGSGDPTLGSPQIPGNPTTAQILDGIATAIRAAGIREISTLVGDTSALDIEPIPWSWTYDDFGNYFGAPISALNLHDNLYKLTFRPGVVGGPAAIASIEPQLDWLEFHNDMRTGPAGSGDNGYIFGVPESHDRWLRGTVPAGNSFFIYGAMPDPADAFLRLLRTRLQAAGISVGGIERRSQASPTGEILWQQASPPLLDIVRHINGTSFNLYADGLLALAAQQKAGTAAVTSWRQATQLETDWAKSLGVPDRGLRIEDGSGLSRRNLVTAEALTALIRSDSLQSWWPQYRNTLNPSHGPGRPAGAARGKSGFIEGVRTLSGTIRCKSDRQLAFSILVNHYDGTIAQADDFISDVLDRVWQTY
ncbi:D-alanyl-D-alanine carboxypeptidase/D-alanyl-D-alanine-endopeptidase [Synechococcus sp. PCC 7336]|uniref:D-alanyl-D-alanine carboxypeptidase/D-alanyl-D-alanine endopeptidase n=1 Tax=Synechococcus sp. PCC 7336 TaxID=195250 RepID=UPI00037F3036|nr:D-alanyl-D-alanine carboxypeptidase/D-alanyl-D-alanine-endopeptidase [Synechococcus sp. PCC 7336]